MLNWFGRKPAAPLEFVDNEAAFAHACTVAGEPQLGAVIPALVVVEGTPGREGERCFLLRLADPAGGRELWGCTMANAPAHPGPGDLVGFRVVRVASELPAAASLIGYIACRLEPVLVPGKGWRIAASFAPADLKPEIRF
jgi:hypothetical protein